MDEIKQSHDPIAIVGISCQLPGGINTVDQFWNLLIQEKNMIRPLHSLRWKWPANVDATAGYRGIDQGVFFENIDCFDANFFNISPKEAKLMDPQQRMLLEASWQCIEDAGLNPLQLAGSKTGVYIGISNTDYHTLLLQAHQETGGYLSTGSGHYAAANRLSYFFNLIGPSVAIDTASSSSLVALCQAVDAIRNRQCEQALVGGINLICTPDNSISYYHAGMLSPDAKCKSFDAGADGYVRGEGGAVVFLKPLDKAITDGHHIYGVIRGSAVNHNGRTSSITVPSASSQAALLREIYSRVDFKLETLSYIETHGSGTPVGDPLEIEGLTHAFKGLSNKKWRCGLGSVKSNIGHLEPASGIFGLLKVLMAFQHQQLPATLNHIQLNPNIDFTDTPFYIVDKSEEWIRQRHLGEEQPLRAGVSSFGLGGVNAHVVLESYVDKRPCSDPIKSFQLSNKIPLLRKFAKIQHDVDRNDAPQLLVFSAKNKEALKNNIEKFLGYFSSEVCHHPLGDIAYTLQVGRATLSERFAVVAMNQAEVPGLLQAYLHGDFIDCQYYVGSVALAENSVAPTLSTMELALKKFNLEQLAQWWVKGAIIDWSRIHPSFRRRVPLPTYSFIKEKHWVSVQETSDLPSPKRACIADLQQNILQIMATVLQIESDYIGPDVEMSELGFDSLAFHELARRINECYGERLTPAVFFETHTLAGLTQYLQEKGKNSPIKQAHRDDRKVGKKEQDIAIIGMAATMPKSENLHQFWRNLISGIDLVDEIPIERWGRDAFMSAEQPELRFGGFISNVEKFDPEFFHISPLEAELMDPQQRCLMQTIWQTIADARMDVKTFSDTNTGLFVGVMGADYSELIAANKIAVNAYTPIGLAHSMLANRISFLLNMKGPSEAIDTACSSSLVAVHRAVVALQQGECDMAFAGGVNLILSPTQSNAFSQAGMLSKDARCKTFDKSANGYVRAEGVAALLLKPLSQALVDGDVIHGVIKGAAVNHGGRATSLTAPNANAQADLLVDAYTQANIDPIHLGYIETHGTGTSLGDPVEINGLKKAFSRLYSQWGHDQLPKPHCGLGSVKSNMGHAEACAGIAGIIKVLLAMKQNQLPGMLHFKELNPFIDLSQSPFYIVDKNQDWSPLRNADNQPIPRYAGVSSFGFGGVNAHVVLSDYHSTPCVRAEYSHHFNLAPYWFLPLTQDVVTQPEQPNVSIQTLYWKDATDINVTPMKIDEHIIVLIEPENLLMSGESFYHETAQCTCMVSESTRLATRFYEYAIQLFALIKGLIEKKPTHHIRIQVVVPSQYERLVYCGLSGLLKSAQLENPAIIGQLIQIDGQQTSNELRIKIQNNVDVLDADIRYQQDVRQIQRSQPLAHHQASAPWKPKGVYLITGGMGALGYLFALDIACKAKSPIVILTGRSLFNKQISSRLEQLGCVAEYHAIDVADERAVEILVQDIVIRHGELNGIIHAAGVLQDNYMLHKTESEFKTVFTPKVDGIIALDNASKHVSLDFFVVFSSFVGCLGNSGQADYAAANAFMDAYISYRNHLVRDGARQGKSLTINWPLWQYGGMQMNVAAVDYLSSKFGMVTIDNEQGLRAFYEAMRSSDEQFLVGTSDKKDLFSAASVRSVIPHESNIETIKADVLERLKQLVSSAAKMPVEKIAGDTLFREYGIDSIMVINLNKQFELIFGDISKTLLYEYQTLNELSDYLIKSYRQECVAWTGAVQFQRSSPGSLDCFVPRTDGVLDSGEAQTRQDDGDKTNDAIAIIGLAGRYPDAEDVHQFWENLKEGKASIKEVPAERWNWQEYFVPTELYSREHNKSYSKWGGFLSGFDEFDSLFFHISPRESLSIDPHERLFLQCSWEVMEDAGYTQKKLDQYNVGVFVGVTKTGFEAYRSEEGLQQGFNPRTSFSSIANRVSYFFNFDGPSLAIDTMCSSSLTAMHIACQHIYNGSCNLALVGGVNLYLHPSNYVYLSQMQMLSADDKNCSFGAGASGFVPGEGVGALLLKRLVDAERDGDNIYGVICSSVVNHGGLTAGYTVPNPNAQRELVSRAIAEAGIHARSISYIEAHGTGTILGDPIEISGLTQAFAPFSDEKQYCAIGSVKSNIGHLEAAAGIAGVTKVLLQFKHQQKVPSLNADELNPNINFSKTPFYVQRTLTDWQAGTYGTERIAGISSFGAGGTNAHVIVKEYLQRQPVIDVEEKPMLIIWTSQYEDGLREYARKLHLFLSRGLSQSCAHMSLENVAYSLSVGREAMTFRAAILVKSMAELLDKLQLFIQNPKPVSSSIYLGEVNQPNAVHLEQYGLADLATSWVTGSPVDWVGLYLGSQAQRISLPTYAFQKKKSWFPASKPIENPDRVRLAEISGNQSPKLSLRPLVDSVSPINLIENKGKTMIDTQQKITLRNLTTVVSNMPSSEATPEPVVFSRDYLDDVKAQLNAQLAELLFLDKSDIKHDEAFVNLGLDSIIGVEWVKKISQHFGIKISATKLYDYPTINDLASFLCKAVARPEQTKQNAELFTSPEKSEAQSPLPDARGSDFLDSLVQEPATKSEVSAERTQDNSQKIAIIGMSGRFPGANNIREFWSNLENGIDSVVDVPKNRWNIDAHYSPSLKAKGKVYTNQLGAVADIDAFDSLFFNLSPVEAECMDPQSRLFLQEAWRAFEDAGYTPEKLAGSQCGSYVGIMQNDYGQMLYEHHDYKGSAQTALGNSSAIFAARMAYILNLKGPAVAIDTACSSSLVAAHMAMMALKTHEIDMALVGGATLYLGVGGYQRMCDAGMLSPSGKCFSFDARADGFVPGEAVTAVILKRLDDAIRDNDPIYGVIIGSGLNQDGKTNGITAPSVASQIELQRNIYQRFKIDPSTISYVETHGTGTKLGDPIEMEALMDVYGQHTEQRQYCAIGSVKSNVGHTSAAAGLVSLQKVLLSMKHRQLVPSLHYQTPNEHIDFTNSPFYVNTELKAWTTSPHEPRRAAINSFGFSGTNAHMVIEEYQRGDVAQHNPKAPVNELLMIPMSAKKPEQLFELALQLQRFLMNSQTNLLDLAYTLQIGRQAMLHRVVFVVSNLHELIEKLAAFSSGIQDIDNVFHGKVAKNKSTTHLLYLDEDMQQGIRQWIFKRKLRQLAEIWVEGFELDWSLFYTEQSCMRISLPTYPFSREKHWFTSLTSEVTSRIVLEEAPISKIETHQNRLFAHYQWHVKPIDESKRLQSSPQTTLFMVDFPEHIVSQIKNKLMASVEVMYSPTASHPGECALQMFTDVFFKVKEWLKEKKEDHAQFIIVVPELPLSCIYASLVSLLKVAALENTRFSGKLIQFSLSEEQDANFVAKHLQHEILDAKGDTHIRYGRENAREIRCLVESKRETIDSSTMIKEGGVYWLTGGLGGLGKIFARHFASLQNVTLILSGRSELTAENQIFMDELCGSGANVEYFQVDVSDKQQVKQTVLQIKQRFNQLNGIVHAAGVIHDALIHKKERCEIRAVWQAKVDGIIHIDEATQFEPLDFMVLFSSIASVLGNIGQADYSGANAFLDEFAAFRNQQVQTGIRSGKTLSINWPLWRDGGMGVDKQTELWFERRAGIVSLATSQGLMAFDEALMRDHDSLLVVGGDLEKIRHYLAIQPRQTPQKKSEETSVEHVDTVQESVRQLCSDLLKINAHELELDLDFSEYGMDSILMMSMLNKLEEKYHQPVEPSVIIDYPTIRTLSDYLIRENIAKLMVAPVPNTPSLRGTKQSSEPYSEPRIASQARKNEIGDEAQKERGQKSRKIAIIGQACRFPQSPTLEKFWDNLVHGHDLITEVSADRWDPSLVYSADKSEPGKTYTNLGGFLDDIAAFDAAFFGINEEEAATIDPQHRIILELAQELFDRAGFTRERVDGTNTSVFIGAKENNYIRNHYSLIPAGQLKHTIVNSIGNMIAARVSDFYNLTGVAKTIDTACSSSLVAVHDACQSIIHGDSELAIAGGIFLLVDSFAHVGFSKANVLSEEGKSYVFDERANGFVLGEGAGLVLLKDYDAALRDGDPIIGVVLGSAVNNDGKTMGLTVPNQEGQKRVIQEALTRSNISADAVSYLEAHGTGTLLGDPIEIRAATQVYQAYTNEKQYCALGSVKSNIGHTMTAAGVASLIKVLLSLQHKKIPATLHCSQPHPRFKFGESPFYPNTELSDWLPRNGTRIAAISSLGFGGTNCHMIIEEAGA